MSIVGLLQRKHLENTVVRYKAETQFKIDKPPF